MNYSSLNKTQRRCVDALVKLDPSLASAESITRKQLEELWKVMFESRSNGGEKIGYPMWIVKGEKVGRGAYKFPAPELAVTSSSVASVKSLAKPMSQEDEEFFAEIAEAGLLEEVA